MFLISNKSKQDVPLPDLGLILKPHQAADLHKLQTKLSPENSEDLRDAIRTGKIGVIKRDDIKPITKAPVDDDVFDKNQLLSELRKAVRDEVRQVSNQASSPDLQQEVLQKLNLLLAGKITTAEEGNDDVSPELMEKIHMKAVDRIVKGATGAIDYDRQKIEDPSLKDRISELDGLI